MNVLTAILSVRAKVYFQRHATVGHHVQFGWTARCINKGEKNNVVIGDYCSIWGCLLCEKDGRIIIGSRTTIRYKTSINSAASVSIGNHCILSNNITIWDNNTHPTDPDARIRLCESGFDSELWSSKYSEKRPVIIEDNVWIGQNALILKGVTIGQGSIVGAHAVVSHDVPPYSVVAGNPAKIVKVLSPASNALPTSVYERNG